MGSAKKKNKKDKTSGSEPSLFASAPTASDAALLDDKSSGAGGRPPDNDPEGRSLPDTEQRGAANVTTQMSHTATPHGARSSSNQQQQNPPVNRDDTSGSVSEHGTRRLKDAPDQSNLSRELRERATFSMQDSRGQNPNSTTNSSKVQVEDLSAIEHAGSNEDVVVTTGKSESFEDDVSEDRKPPAKRSPTYDRTNQSERQADISYYGVDLSGTVPTASLDTIARLDEHIKELEYYHNKVHFGQDMSFLSNDNLEANRSLEHIEDVSFKRTKIAELLLVADDGTVDDPLGTTELSETFFLPNSKPNEREWLNGFKVNSQDGKYGTAILKVAEMTSLLTAFGLSPVTLEGDALAFGLHSLDRYSPEGLLGLSRRELDMMTDKEGKPIPLPNRYLPLTYGILQRHRYKQVGAHYPIWEITNSMVKSVWNMCVSKDYSYIREIYMSPADDASCKQPKVSKLFYFDRSS